MSNSVTPLGVRVITEQGATTGTIEYQLPGSQIASVSCSIRKEAWTKPPTSVRPPAKPPVEGGSEGGSNTPSK